MNLGQKLPPGTQFFSLKMGLLIPALPTSQGYSVFHSASHPLNPYSVAVYESRALF